jgi:uncharacterized protein (DUF433 family)
MSNFDGHKERGGPRRVFELSAAMGGKFTLRDTGVTVEEILSALDQQGEPQVLKQFGKQGITVKDIETCLAIAAHSMPDRKEFLQNGLGSDVHILFDENTPYRIIPKIINETSRLVHISFERLTTFSDPAIWRYARNHGFKALVTNDSDFLRITELEILDRIKDSGSFDVKIDDLPLVVYMTHEDKSRELTEEVCRQHINSIVHHAALTGRQTAYVFINDHSFTEGLSPREIYHRYVRPSIAGVQLDQPVFDSHIIDHNTINGLRQKFGFPLMTFTRAAEWDAFYDRHYKSDNPEGPKPWKTDPPSGPS